MIKTILIDARTPEHVIMEALAELRACTKYGVDCETEDSEAHEGLQIIQRKKFIVDHRRATMTGFSWYVDGSDRAYYVNLTHADVENRMPDSFVNLWYDAIPKEAMGISHNAPYELVSFKQRYNLWLPNLVCSMQLAVTHHGPDNYDQSKFYKADLSCIRPILPGIIEDFATYDPKKHGRNLTADQAFTYGQFAGKASKAAHSYNGFIDKIAYSYGLKKLVKQIFGYDMTTFEEVLGSRSHMGELTGEETVEYGAEDAYWCVQVFNHLYDNLMKHNPKALITFFKQENPMIYVFAEAAIGGLKLNKDEIYKRQELERKNTAQLLREIKKALKDLLPFSADPNPEMMRLQPYYAKNDTWKKKRQQIVDWVNTPDSDDDFEMVTQVSNPIGNAWAEISGNGRLNINYWQTARVILYDLLGHKLVRVAGKVTSDAEARGRVMLTYQLSKDEKKAHLLHLMNKMGSVEQAMKLYITPYTQLIDPETNRVYPTINSMLATRRMAMQNPNAMQLAKYGDSAYVRSYFEPDDADHVVLSADWSGVELVLIGEFSGDPEFCRVFGQIPYDDLHSGAAADCLAVKTLPGLTLDEYLGFKKNLNPNNRELRHLLTGQPQEPKDYFKYTRGTPVGKGANFNYWYSGALGTVAENLGWTTEEMWAGVERYRERFWKAEEWRVGVCDSISKYGYIELPDGHRRERFEATAEWWLAMQRKFAQQGGGSAVMNFGELFMKGMQTRARNQAVNAMIQGSCAGMAKQAILAINAEADHRFFRFMMPIHDELVFSVHKDYVLEFITIMRRCMNNQTTFVKTLPLHCTVAIGKTFGVKDQIELDEANPIEGVIPEEYAGQPLPENIVQNVINYVMESKT
jgi:DNA polymerase I-like protein with 3'-5' exonuclease and polymerase domains